MLFSLIVEAAGSAIRSPAEVGIEGTMTNLVLWLELFIEMVGASLVGLGVVLTMGRLAGVFRRPSEVGYEKTRLVLARFLILGLEFQLAADIIATAVAPTWSQLGKLAAIAVIRTGLNYFLAREMEKEQKAGAGGFLGNKEAPSET
jgi:uncharacterized membrane protein